MGPGKKILLTGGAGFIGSSCLEAFVRTGAQVVVLDALSEMLYGAEMKRDNLKEVRQHGEFEFHEVDIRQRAALEAVFAKHDDIDVVVHLAALAGVRPSIANAPKYYDVNVRGSATLMEVARAHGVKRFVLASSSSVYGTNTKTPFAEDDPVINPASPYAASKRAMELMAQTDFRLHGGDITCLRFFTVYGPRQRPDMAINKFMRIIAAKERLPMFGDGTSGRDYTYIDDIVQGVCRAVEQLDGYNVYNLGGDKVVLLKELIATIADVMGVEALVDQLPMQPGDVPLTMADLTRSRAELGYSPTTALRQGVEKMWAWHQRRYHGTA